MIWRVKNLTKTYFDLIELIEQQCNIIKHQSETITKLISDNAEQENLIKEMFE